MRRECRLHRPLWRAPSPEEGAIWRDAYASDLTASMVSLALVANALAFGTCWTPRVNPLLTVALRTEESSAKRLAFVVPLAIFQRS